MPFPDGTDRQDPDLLHIEVDLKGEAARDFRELLSKRELSVAQAVRKALSLLHLFDSMEYELIRRKKEDGSLERLTWEEDHT